MSATVYRPVTAAVTRDKGAPFALEAAQIRNPRGDEVLVRIVATGMCHTDMIVRDQHYPVPLPAVLGHEGSGIVEAVGPLVQGLQIGDHVVLTYGYCGHCLSCGGGHTAYCQEFFGRNFSGGDPQGESALQDEAGQRLNDHFFAQSSFATLALQGLLAIDQAGRVRNANRAAQRLLGLAQYQPDGRHLDQLFDASTAIDLHCATQQLTFNDGSRLFARVLEQPRPVVSRNARLSQPASPMGADAGLNRQLQQAHKAFAAGVPILLQGETGTGKEVFARALHEHWNPQAPVVAINCSAIPESLIEAELFGYAEGTFTGARKGGASGLLEAAHGGTLLLDEIGDMPAALQTRLLRVLQEREITRLGSSKRQPLDVRVISATHCDLSQHMAARQFRQDLYYRLNGLSVPLPALREREDLDILIERLRLRHAGPPLHTLALQALRRQNWPGNVRQLEQTLRLASALAQDEALIRLEHLPMEVQQLPMAAPDGDLEATPRRTVESALVANGGNISAAAAQLGISRTTLYKKMRR